MEFNPAVITTKGHALITEALAGNSNIIFTKIVTGDGVHVAPEDISQLTELASPQQEFPLSSKEIINDNTVHLKYIVSNINPDSTVLETGYFVKEVGLYAKADTQGAEEILYSVTTAIENKADWLPPYNGLQPSTITMDWYTAVANASNVTIQGASGAVALADDLGQISELNTTSKTSVVDAINELAGNVGNLNALSTEARSSLVAAINELIAIVVANGAGAHNAIYRGKYLGSSVTEKQWAAIQNGTFEGLYVGDYWIINNVTWRIAAFDYYYNTGDTAFVKHHAVIVPDAPLYNAKMNNTNTTEGAYYLSAMKTTNLAAAVTQIEAAFGTSHVLEHRNHFQNAVTNGRPSAGTWYSTKVDLMTEQNVYGCKCFAPVSDGSSIPNNYVVDKSQFALFALAPHMISNCRQWFWLRDVVSSSDFADVYGGGSCTYYGASASGGVRPAFCIG